MAAKILIVDDEPQFERLLRQRFRRKIKDQEYDFFFARNGRLALELLEQEEDFDIVLSDINMPEMGGLAFLHRLKESYPRIKAVMVSAYGDMSNIRAAMNLGAFDFVTKPINFSDLDATIQKTLQEVTLLKEATRIREQLIRIQQELIAAGEVQKAFIPRHFSIFPPGSPFELFGEMISAKEVGGDFYDFFMIDAQRLGFVIGDVSGKGMPAALLMVVCRTLVRAIGQTGCSADECLEQVNRLISQDNPTIRFVTLLYGIINIRNGAATYCNAGHPPPFLIEDNGQLQPLDAGVNTVIGVAGDLAFQSREILLPPGASLILYTDGITEATDQNQSFYGEERLMKYLKNCSSRSSQEIVKELINKIQDFASSRTPADDRTVLVIRRKL